MSTERDGNQQHGPPHPPGQPRQQELLGCRPGLGAEAAAHVAGDHAHLVGVQAVGTGDEVPHGVDPLARRPVDQAVARPVRRRHPSLHRARRHPVVAHGDAHDDLARLDRRAVTVAGGVQGDVGPRLGEEEGLAARRVDHVHDRRQRVDIDHDSLGGVGAGRLRLADDRHQRFADVAHPVGGEGPPHHALGEGREQVGERPQVEIGSGHHVDDAGHGPGVVDVDGGHDPMGHAGRHVGDVGQAGQGEVGHEGGVAAQQGIVLAAEDGGAVQSHAAVVISQRRRSAGPRIDRRSDSVPPSGSYR